MVIINASDFSLRNDLENYIKSILGLTPDLKQDYEIQGTKQQLGRLNLSNRSVFWGVRCVELDEKGTKVSLDNKINIKPNRGN